MLLSLFSLVYFYCIFAPGPARYISHNHGTMYGRLLVRKVPLKNGIFTI